MRWFLFFCLMVFAGLRTQAYDGKYTVKKGETAWFLASLFYGEPNDYKKILETNHFQKPEEMKEGMLIQIDGPKYFSTQVTFIQRYTDLWEKRELELNKDRQPAQTTAQNETRRVVIPLDRILRKDSLHQLPFTEVADPGKSASEMAQDELRRGAQADLGQ